MVKDRTKTEYEPLLPEIDGIPLKSVKHTFRDCLFLAVAPVIPESVTDIFATFDGCISLTKTPKIPKGVKDLSYTFNFCGALTEPPEIPDGVVNMRHCFDSCISLTKAPRIPKSVRYMRFAFYNCNELKEIPRIPDFVEDREGVFSRCEKVYKEVENAKISFEWDTLDNNELTISGILTLNGESIDFIINMPKGKLFYGYDDELSDNMKYILKTYDVALFMTVKEKLAKELPEHKVGKDFKNRVLNISSFFVEEEDYSDLGEIMADCLPF